MSKEKHTVTLELANKEIIEQIDELNEKVENINRFVDGLTVKVNDAYREVRTKEEEIIGYITLEDKRSYRPEEIFMFLDNEVTPEFLIRIAQMLKQPAREDNFEVYVNVLGGERFLLVDDGYCYADKNYNTQLGDYPYNFSDSVKNNK